MNLSEALKIIDSGEVFSCTVVSYDKARKKGGKKRFFSEVKVATAKNLIDSKLEKKEPKLNKKNHYENSTRTLFQCINKEQTSSVVTIHIFLILEVNGEKLML